MKKLVVLALFSTLIGCASTETKITKYCDENWQGRFDSWQACYNRKMDDHHIRAKQWSDNWTSGNRTPTCTTWNGYSP